MENSIPTSNVTNLENHDFNLDVEKTEKKEKIIMIIRQVIIYALLTFAGILCLFPFIWMILTSLKTIPEYEDIISSFFPKTFHYQNYIEAFNSNDGLFSRTLVNSIVVGLLSTGLGVILTILSAYAFARMKFTGKNFFFSLLLMTMMIPGELFTTTNYITTAKFGWTDTFTIMIVPFLCSIYYIYLLRNSFMQIPESLYKAAKVDGCSDFKFLCKVMIPMAGPTIISITILKLIGVWNSYMWPQLVNRKEWRLVSNWMALCSSNSAGDVDIPMKMAAAVIVSIPLFLVFIFLRKYIMRGVSKSGIKG